MPTQAAAAFLLLLVTAAASEEAAPRAEPDALQCLAEAVYFEARGRSAEARLAVAHVVVNRAEDPDFPDTVCEVVEDGCQFSYECDGWPETLDEPRARANAFETARTVLAGASSDPTGGALYFHAERVRPSWAAELTRTAAIGGNVFYR